MEVPVNWIAVVLAGLSTMVVGSIWYMPSVFGNTWMKLTGVDPNKKQSGAQMAYMYGGVFLASIVTAFIVAHFTYLAYDFFKVSFLQTALTTAFWGWLGFTALRIFTHDTFEGRRKKLTLINAAHELVTFLVIGLIIGLFGV